MYENTKPTGTRHAQNQAFAIIRSITPRLKASGLSPDALWQWVLDNHNVTSRSDLTEKQWVILSARLFAAQRNTQLFDHLCNTIRQSVTTCRVYRSDIRTGKRTKVYDGIVTTDITQRCQKHADATGCDVELHNVDGIDGLQMFEPAEYAHDPDMPPIAPIDKTTPARLFEIHTTDNKTQFVEIRFPDTSRLRQWCQQYVAAYGIDLIVTDQLAQNTLMKFSVNDSETNS